MSLPLALPLALALVLPLVVARAALALAEATEAQARAALGPGPRVPRVLRERAALRADLPRNPDVSFLTAYCNVPTFYLIFWRINLFSNFPFTNAKQN